MSNKKIKIKKSTISIMLGILLGVSFTSAQEYDLVIEKVDGTTTISVSSITKMSFAPATCGVSTVLYSGAIYNTVLIGSQCWLKENLNVGTQIAGIVPNELDYDLVDQTNNGTLEKFCYNDLAANCTAYGGLYQWAEAVQYSNGATNYTSPFPLFSGNIQGICPPGWHIPTISEFQILIDAVGSDQNKLTTIGQTAEATNTSGFSALLGGSRNYIGYSSITTYTWFWSISESYGPNLATPFLLSFDINEWEHKSSALSVRCLKD